MITVVIPTHNRRGLIMRAVKSVLAQSFQDFEIIVVDDGSTDGTEVDFTSKDIDSRVRYYKFEKNRGVHIARNFGIDKSQGDIVAFLDSDDEWFTDALEITNRVFSTQKEVGVLFAPFLTEEGVKTGYVYDNEQIIPLNDLVCNVGRCEIKGGFPAVRKSAIGNIRWETPFLQFIFYRRIAKESAVYFYPKALGIYHRNSDQFSVSKIRSKIDLNLSIQRARELDTFLKEFGPIIKQNCKNQYSYYAYGAAVGLLLDNKKQQSIKRSLEAFRYRKKIFYFLFFIFTVIPFSPTILNALFRVIAFVKK